MRAPKHLRRSKKLWSKIDKEFQLNTEHVELLRLLCEGLDRLDELREQIAEQGVSITTKTGYLRPNPLLKSEHDCSNRVLNTWKSLGFERTPSAFIDPMVMT